MNELHGLRLSVYQLALDSYEAGLTDEEWYDRLWELLDPVVDARAERQLAAVNNLTEASPTSLLRFLNDVHTHDAGEYRDPDTGRTQWAASSTDTPPPHVDSSKFDDPDNG